MRIFGYDIRLITNSVRRDDRRTAAIQVYRPRFDMYNFAKAEILDCSKMIANRLANVQLHAAIDYIATERIFDFLKRNRLQIVRRLWFDGFVIIDCKTMTFSRVSEKTSRSADGVVVFNLSPTEIVYASETYESTGESDYSFAKQKCAFLNIVNSADRNLIENYGAMGVISPETDNSVNGATLSEEEITDLQESYRKSYGVTLGKWTLMFTPRPVKYSKIELPISQLQLDLKRQYVLKAIYASFGIPKELSVYFESAKYANKNEAELDMYSNTVTAWANAFLDIARKMYRKEREIALADGVRLMDNEFWFDIVGVYALQEAAKKEKEAAREEFEFWKKIIEEYPRFSETAEKRMEDLIERI